MRRGIAAPADKLGDEDTILLTGYNKCNLLWLLRLTSFPNSLKLTHADMSREVNFSFGPANRGKYAMSLASASMLARAFFCCPRRKQ
jgi:hypothetical protein